jgi:hypothetical protein
LIDLGIDEKVLLNNKESLLALNEKWYQWIGSLAIIAIGEDGRRRILFHEHAG